MSNEERYYSVSKTAEILNVSKRTVYRWIDSGVLEAEKDETGHVLIPEEQVLQKKKKSVSSVVNCIYVCDDGKGVSNSINHILNKEGLIRSNCKVFIDTDSNIRKERESLLDFIETKASTVLYVVSKENLAKTGSNFLERYLKAVNCELRVVY